MAAKRVDPKSKQQRQKIMAIVGSVLLVGVLAIQVPRTMKMLNPPSAAAESPTTAPAPPPPGGVPGSVPTPVGDLVLVDVPLAPQPQDGQLVSFELFKSKDPFVQQVKPQGGGDSGEPPADVPLPPGVAAPDLPPDVAVPSPPSPPAASPGSGGDSAAPTMATISVNGVEETVAVGKDFPADDPLFTLVSLTATSAQLAIAGGSYQDGAATVTVVLGKPLTLMNTTDGARYEIRLVSVGASTDSE